MKAWMMGLAVATVITTAMACSDDDADSDGGAGSGGMLGGAGSGGAPGGGGASGGGRAPGGANSGGAAGDGGESAGSAGMPEGGTGGVGTPITCDPPPPPLVGGGDGGAAGGVGGAGAGAGAGGGTAAAGAGGDGPDTSAEPLALAGAYVDEWDTQHAITSERWLMGDSVFHVAAFDNTENWIVARNDQDNEWNPCAWSRFDWMESEDELYFCTTAFDAETEAAARETPAADADDLENGCSGFPWTELTPVSDE